jgi:hypothetical protein
MLGRPVGLGEGTTFTSLRNCTWPLVLAHSLPYRKANTLDLHGNPALPTNALGEGCRH